MIKLTGRPFVRTKTKGGLVLTSMLFALVAASGCFLETSNARYSKRYKATIEVIARASDQWMYQAEEDYTSQSVWSKARNDRARALIDEANSGFIWSEFGVPISIAELAEKIGCDSQSLSYDGWDGKIEYRVAEGFLIARSPGADGVFEGPWYTKDEFAWPSGGDLVSVAGSRITVPKDHWRYDDWLYQGEY